MALTKAIRDARAALKAAQATVATINADKDANAARVSAAFAKSKPAKARLARVRAIIKQPGDQYALTTLDTLRPGSYPPEAIGDKETVRAYTKRLVEGNAKVTIAGGQQFAPKSIPLKVRVLTKADERLVVRAEAKRRRASEALRKAESELTATLGEVFGRSDKVTIERVAPDLAAIGHAARQAELIRREQRLGVSNDLWRAERAVEDGKVHLAWAESRTKDPCNCNACVSERRAKQREVEHALAMKAKAKEEAAERRKIARLPRREFVCPTALAIGASGERYEDPHETEPDADGKVWVTSPVFTDPNTKVKYVECPDCESAFGLTTVLSRPLGNAPGQQQLIAA